MCSSQQSANNGLSLRSALQQKERAERDQQGDRIRLRLLNRLGIYSPRQQSPLLQPPSSAQGPRAIKKEPSSSPKKLFGAAALDVTAAYEEPLFYRVLESDDSSSSDEESVPEDASFTSSCNSYSTSITASLTSITSSELEDDEDYCRPTAVKFHSQKKVVEIPSFRDYPEEIHSALWHSVDDIQNNAKRNRLEYFAEGWSLESVLEEPEFVEVNGELIHPETWRRHKRLEEYMMIAAEEDVGESAEDRMIRLYACGGADNDTTPPPEPSPARRLGQVERSLRRHKKEERRRRRKHREAILSAQQQKNRISSPKTQGMYMGSAAASLTRFADT
jgi:hypothetical protein